jgi:hypothetical protein
MARGVAISAPPARSKGFTAGFLSFARATRTFRGSKQLTIDSVRCGSSPAASPVGRGDRVGRRRRRQFDEDFSLATDQVRMRADRWIVGTINEGEETLPNRWRLGNIPRVGCDRMQP